MSIGVRTENDTCIMYVDDPEFQETIQRWINEAHVLILFNGKFDLHYLRRYGFDFSHCRVWDCQLAEFLLNSQLSPYPSLNKTAEKYGLGTKLDIVKTEYWDKGISSENVPRDILSEYLAMDLELTEAVYEKQVPLIAAMGLRPLLSLHCADLLVLADMEYNGMRIDNELAEQLALEEEKKVEEYTKIMNERYEDYHINWNSRDHLSCYLYGGTITYETRVCVGAYKSGAKEGLPRYKVLEHVFELPRLVEPPKGSELAKEGYYSTDEETLKSIRASKESKKRIKALLDRTKSNKLMGTYYRGIPKLSTTMGWNPQYIHGTFNQCVAITGRLSSTKPNLQNFAAEVKQILITRYN